MYIKKPVWGGTEAVWQWPCGAHEAHSSSKGVQGCALRSQAEPWSSDARLNCHESRLSMRRLPGLARHASSPAGRAADGLPASSQPCVVLKTARRSVSMPSRYKEVDLWGKD